MCVPRTCHGRGSIDDLQTTPTLDEKKARRGTMGLIVEFLDRDAYKAKVYEVMLRHFNNLRKTK